MSEALEPAGNGDLRRDWCPSHQDGRLWSSQRVLSRAEDETLPLNVRMRLLAVVAASLDQFFTEGGTPGLVQGGCFERAGALMVRHAACFRDSVRPALAARGIEIVGWEEMTGAERGRLHRWFGAHVYPLLTPLVVDPAHPFPFISGMSLNLAAIVSNGQTQGRRFARLEIPATLPRLIEASPCRFAPLEDVIAAHLTRLFEGAEIHEQHAFRVTRGRLPRLPRLPRDARTLQREPVSPRWGPAVRLEVEDSMPDGLADLLAAELGVAGPGVYRLRGTLDLAALIDPALSALARARARARTHPVRGTHRGHLRRMVPPTEWDLCGQGGERD